MLAVSLWRGWLHLRRGELADAATSLRTALDELDAWHGAAGGDVYAAAHYALTQFERGDLDGARRALDAALRDQIWTSLEAARWWAAVECELLLASGRARGGAGAGRAHARRAAARRQPARPSPGARPRRARCTGSGAPRRRSRVADENLAIARRFGAPVDGGARAARARRDAGRGRDRALEEAVALLEGTPARLELAKSLAALGRALRHARRPSEAREPLRRALELADVCGAAGLAEDVRDRALRRGRAPAHRPR